MSTNYYGQASAILYQQNATWSLKSFEMKCHYIIYNLPNLKSSVDTLLQ